jgi:hypothetical protein
LENITRGDKKYSDPDRGTKGTLYKAIYNNDNEVLFRRHNSKNPQYKLSNRFRLTLQYATAAKEKLKSCPVIYLGLTRLVPFGEFDHGDSQNLKILLPVSGYRGEIQTNIRLNDESNVQILHIGNLLNINKTHLKYTQK